MCKHLSHLCRSNQVDVNFQHNENTSRTVEAEPYPRYSYDKKQIYVADKPTKNGSYSEASSAYSGSDVIQVIDNYVMGKSKTLN